MDKSVKEAARIRFVWSLAMTSFICVVYIPVMLALVCLAFMRGIFDGLTIYGVLAAIYLAVWYAMSLSQCIILHDDISKRHCNLSNSQMAARKSLKVAHSLLGMVASVFTTVLICSAWQQSIIATLFALCALALLGIVSFVCYVLFDDSHYQYYPLVMN